VVAVIAIAVLATFLQRITGFGFALMSVPLMSLVIAPSLAVVVASLCSFPNTMITAWQLRAHIQPALVRRFAGWSIVGMPFGLVILKQVPERPFRVFLGVVVALATVFMASGWRPRRVAPTVEAGAGVVAGVLATATGTNGPPLVLALQAHRLTPDQFRGTISGIFVASNVSLLLYWWRGLITGPSLALAGLALPLVPLAALAGLRASRRLRDAHFDRLVIVLLFASAASAIYGGLRR
jgi:uncharacterized membrane protein YfcA